MFTMFIHQIHKIFAILFINKLSIIQHPIYLPDIFFFSLINPTISNSNKKLFQILFYNLLGWIKKNREWQSINESLIGRMGLHLPVWWKFNLMKNF